jgi:hypothetical protein
MITTHYRIVKDETKGWHSRYVIENWFEYDLDTALSSPTRHGSWDAINWCATYWGARYWVWRKLRRATRKRVVLWTTLQREQ